MLLSCSWGKNKNNNDSAGANGAVYEILAAGLQADTVESAPVMAIYEGELLNIFFHPLVARPEIAFKGSMKKHFLDWFVTAEEFRKILNELYTNNYVLINIDELYEVTYTNGVKKITDQKLMVPEGKKPIVISIDDLCYYEHMRENGCVHKLVVDEKGGIAAWTDNADGGELSYDKDIVTILESFIKEHPNFSLRGAKAIIALTGYEGVLGYKTDEPDLPGYKEEVEKATAVVNRLKEMGWRFASHSWGHLNLPKVPMSWFTNDNRLWERQVKPIMGDTDLYIYPFGAGLESQEDKHKILRDKGFNLFFGVGGGHGHSVRPGYIYLTRRNIDGVYFNLFKDRNDGIFDVNKVVDKESRGL